MDLETLLADVPKSAFVEEYFHRLPFARAQTAETVCRLGTWEVLARLLACNTADVMVVRDGQQYSGESPRGLDEARALGRAGYTILVRHAERHDAELEALAHAFARDFAADVDVHVYATPPGKHGFSWHYDAEDVFIIQTSGAKEYSLRKNTVHPWPLVETMPPDMAYPREIMPLMRVCLHAGDWLYIPCGYWHKADAVGDVDTAISLAIGVMSPAAIDYYDFVRAQLLPLVVWRQRLPVAGSAGIADRTQLRAQYRERITQLANDLQRTLTDPRLLDAFLDALTDKHGRDAP